MTRIKRSVAANKRKKNLLKRAKGFLNGASNRFREAKERLLRAERHAYEGRKLRKRDFRSLWITRINGALDQIGETMNYSTFINLLKKAEITLNRKSISELAIRDIEEFKSLVAKIQIKK